MNPDCFFSSLEHALAGFSSWWDSGFISPTMVISLWATKHWEQCAHLKEKKCVTHTFSLWYILCSLSFITVSIGGEDCSSQNSISKFSVNCTVLLFPFRNVSNGKQLSWLPIIVIKFILPIPILG